MKFQSLPILLSISALSVATAYASPQAQDGAKILQDKAISYAMHAKADAQFDVKAASRELSQNALELGKIYSGNYDVKLNDITEEQCLNEVAQLGVDSESFLNKALAQQYKTIATVNGNQVMMIASGAGEITYIVIDKGGYCTVDKSRRDAYWAANIMRLGLDGLNVTFS